VKHGALPFNPLDDRPGKGEGREQKVVFEQGGLQGDKSGNRGDGHSTFLLSTWVRG